MDAYGTYIEEIDGSDEPFRSTSPIGITLESFERCIDLIFYGFLFALNIVMTVPGILLFDTVAPGMENISQSIFFGMELLDKALYYPMMAYANVAELIFTPMIFILERVDFVIKPLAYDITYAEYYLLQPIIFVMEQLDSILAALFGVILQ